MDSSQPFADAPLRVEDLALVRGGRTLFSDLSLAAGSGDYVEIVGPNGAGKTSLLRAIAGFLRPAAGRICFAGDLSLAAHMLGHRDGLKPALTVKAHLDFWIGLLGSQASADAALDRVGLASLAALPTRVLSQGQGRRLALARLIAVPRPLWLLDEPAAGLDANGKALLADLVREHCGGGGIALAAVHEPLGPKPTQTVALA